MTHNSLLCAARKTAPVLHSLTFSLSLACSQAMASHRFTSVSLPVCTAGNTGMFFKDSHYATPTFCLLIEIQSDPFPLSHLSAMLPGQLETLLPFVSMMCKKKFLLFYRGTEWLSDLFKVSSRAHSWSCKIWTVLKNRELFIVCLLDNSDITWYFPVMAVRKLLLSDLNDCIPDLWIAE